MLPVYTSIHTNSPTVLWDTVALARSSHARAMAVPETPFAYWAGSLCSAQLLSPGLHRSCKPSLPFPAFRGITQLHSFPRLVARTKLSPKSKPGESQCYNAELALGTRCHKMPVPLHLPCSSKGDTPSSKINRLRSNIDIYKSSTLILECALLIARSCAAYHKPCALKVAAPSSTTAKATYSRVRRQQLRQAYDCWDQEELEVGCSEHSKVLSVPAACPGPLWELGQCPRCSKASAITPCSPNAQQAFHLYSPEMIAGVISASSV